MTNTKTMNLSELVVTESGALKEKHLTHVQWSAITGIHLWTDKDYQQVWRYLECVAWLRVQEEFES